MAAFVQRSLLLFLEIEGCVGTDSLLVAVHSYSFPYIMHFLCTFVMQKRHDEENFISEKWNSCCPSSSPWSWVLLEVQHCTLEENPLHSNLIELTYLAFLCFMCLFHTVEGWVGRCLGWRVGLFEAVKSVFNLIQFPCKLRILWMRKWEQKLQIVPFHWTQRYLMKDINYSHSSILHTASMHISWPRTFWAYLTSFYCSTFIRKC